MLKDHDIAPLDGYSSEVGLLAAGLIQSTEEWREELGVVGVDTVRWQPFVGSHSIGALILHMADAEAWWIETIVAGRKLSKEELDELMSEETKQYGVLWPSVPKKPIAHYYAIHDRVRARTLETLKEFDDSARACKVGKSRTFTVRWIINHLINHEGYHGGQAVFLKLLKQKST